MALNRPIFTRRPTRYPDRPQLFSTRTPNGVKVGIMLEETRLAYEPRRIDTMANENHDPASFCAHPDGKIAAIYEPDGPGGRPPALFESGVILTYLADKTGQFLSTYPNTRYETIRWLMWQLGGVRSKFGQVGFFNAILYFRGILCNQSRSKPLKTTIMIFGFRCGKAISDFTKWISRSP